MKNLLIQSALLLIVSQSFAQQMKDGDVPVAVRQAFSQKFPKAKEVKWSKESNTEYEAEFKGESANQSSNFDSSGKWLITETEISTKSLPTAVQATLKREFSGYKIEESELAQTPDRGTFYELELEKGQEAIVAQIDANGKTLKTEKSKESGEKKD
ncbi:MAG: PepSY-like domain-containing protein [Bacteroidetes bacterium]|nr:PepSY-like domain-containing protein [Bacteroidota bacterium]